MKFVIKLISTAILIFLLSACAEPLTIDDVKLTGQESSLRDGQYTGFILSVKGKDVSFTGACNLYNVSDKIIISDVTGDGMPDICVVFITASGTGVRLEEIHIFDGVTLEKYQITDIQSVLDEHVDPYSDDENFFVIADETEYKVAKSLVPITPENSPDEAFFEFHRLYEVEENTIVSVIPIQIGMFDFFGHIKVSYAFKDSYFSADVIEISEDDYPR